MATAVGKTEKHKLVTLAVFDDGVVKLAPGALEVSALHGYVVCSYRHLGYPGSSVDVLGLLE